MKFGTSNSSGYLLSLLRAMSGLLFLEHGTSKVFSFPPGAPGPHPGFTLSTLTGVSPASSSWSAEACSCSAS
jgi:uncharacterized membrane protein YphA (DoxX/SURF4 family)